MCSHISDWRTLIYIGRYLNKSYVWHVFYVSKHLYEFYYEEKVHYEAWERSNRLILMFMRMTVAYSIKTTLLKTDNAKRFMGLVGERSQTANKSLTETLMSTLTTIKFDGSCIMHEHVIEMTNIAQDCLSMTHSKWAIISWKINEICMNCTVC